MRPIVLALILVFLGGRSSLAAPSLWTQNFLWKELKSILVSRCQTYTPDENYGCYYATNAVINEFKKDISENSNHTMSHLGVAFKPELFSMAQDDRTERLLDFWIQRLKYSNTVKNWNSSLFDETVKYVGSEEVALQAFAVVLQDVSDGIIFFDWLKYQIPHPTNFDLIEKWRLVIELIREVPMDQSKFFYPSALWSSASSVMNPAFYHFYVMAYTYSKIQKAPHVTLGYGATAVFLFNYFYENVQENGKLKATLFEPEKMQDPTNLKDIRNAYLASTWVTYRKNLPLLYAQTAFLKLDQGRLKDSLQVWIDRLLAADSVSK